MKRLLKLFLMLALVGTTLQGTVKAGPIEAAEAKAFAITEKAVALTKRTAFLALNPVVLASMVAVLDQYADCYEHMTPQQRVLVDAHIFSGGTKAVTGYNLYLMAETDMELGQLSYDLGQSHYVASEWVLATLHFSAAYNQFNLAKDEYTTGTAQLAAGLVDFGSAKTILDNLDCDPPGPPMP